MAKKKPKNSKKKKKSLAKLPTELTDLQKNFCGEYIKDFNQTKAAIRAGYAKKNARIQGSQLMTNPLVTAFIVELQKQIAERHDLTADGIILNLKNLRNECLDMIMYPKSGPAFAMVALRANELLGQHIGMWPKKIEIDHKMIEQEKKQVENQRKVLKLVDGFAARKSVSHKKAPRLAIGGAT